MGTRVETRSGGDCGMNPVEGASAGPSQGSAARKVEAPAGDSVEQYATQNDAQSGMVGELLEAGLLVGLKALGPGGRMELELSGRGGIGEGAFFGAKAKATVEHTADGVRMKLTGGLSGGVGAAIPELGDATVGVTVDGGLSFLFRSDKEAADAVAAMIQSAPRAAALIPGIAVPVAAAVQLLADPDALKRVEMAGHRMESIEGALKIGAGVRASLPAGITKLDLMASESSSPLGFKLDLARGALIVDASFEAEVKAGFWYQVLPGLKLGSLNVGGELKGRYSLEAHYPLSKTDLARVMQGKVKIGDILSDPARQLTFHARGQVTGQLGSAEVGAEKSIPLRSLGDLKEVPALIGNPGGWTFKGHRLGVAVGGGPKVGLNELKGTLRMDTPILDAGRRPDGIAEEILRLASEIAVRLPGGK